MGGILSPQLIIALIITTDSVPTASGTKVRAVCCTPLLADAIRRIHEGTSITTLFNS